MREEEKTFIADKAGLPSDIPQIDPSGFYLTASQIRSYIQDWRNGRKNADSREALCTDDIEKLGDLDRAVHGLLAHPGDNKKIHKPTYKDKTELHAFPTTVETTPGKEIVHYTLDTKHLPHLQGGLKATGNPYLLHLLVDTGATDNIINVALLRKLGLKSSNLKNKTKYVLSSATGKDEDKVLGDIELTVYLRNTKGRYYPVKQKFCVLQGPLLTPILSMKMLRELHFSWKQKLDPISKKPVDEILSLNLPHPSRGVIVRRQFRTSQHGPGDQPPVLHNAEPISLNAGQVGVVTLVADRVPFTSQFSHINMETESFKIHEPLIKIDRRLNSSETAKIQGFRHTPVMTMSCEMTAKQGIEIPPGKLKIPLETCPWVKTSYSRVLGFQTPLGTKPTAPDEPTHTSDRQDPTFTYKDIGCHFAMTSKQMTKPHTSSTGEVLPDYLPTNFEDNLLSNTVYVGPGNNDNVATDGPCLKHLNKTTAKQVQTILKKHKTAISSSRLDVGTIKDHEVDIEPINEDDPATDKFRHQIDSKADLIETCIQEMVDSDIIMEADEPSAWRSNILLVAKPEDGEHFVDRTKASHGEYARSGIRKGKKIKNPRVTLDLRTFNQKVKSTGTLRLPKLEQVLLRLRNKKASKIDIKNAFYSVLLSPKSRKYTCFVSPKTGKRYFFKRIPQGAKNSPQLFQEVLSKILCETTWEQFKEEKAASMPATLNTVQLASCLVTYVDDLLLLTETTDEHLFLLDYVFSMCNRHGLKVDKNKIDILPNDLTYLGVCINCKEGTYRLHEDRVQAFRQWLRPHTKEQLASRLATVSYFSGLLPALKVVCGPLFLLLKSKEQFTWDETAELAWQSLKFLLVMNIKQNLINTNKPLIMTVDASLLAIAGNLFQLDEATNRLVLCASFSKVLSIADAGKSNLYRELLGLIYAVQHFSIHIRSNNQKCLLLTDCSALSFLRQLKSTNTRLQNIAMYLSGFDNLALFHISGTSNFLSDAFSRMFAGQAMDMGMAVPKSSLEKFGPTPLPQGSVINPDALRYLLQQPPDTSLYKETHIKKKIICPTSLATEVIQNLDGFTTEEKVIRAALLGYDPSMQDDYFWNKESKSTGMSESKFRDYNRKYKLESIRDHLQILCTRLEAQDPGTPLNTETWRPFISSLYMLANEQRQLSGCDHLQSLCHEYLHQQASESLLDKIIATYVQSDIYTHTTTVADLYTVIPVYTDHSSEITILNRAGGIFISPTRLVHLHPAQVYTFKADIKIISNMLVTLKLLDSHLDMFCQETAFDRAVYIDKIFVTNDTEGSVTLYPGKPFLQLLFHDGEGKNCACSREKFLARTITTDIVHAVAGYNNQNPLDTCRHATDTLVSNTTFAFSSFISGLAGSGLDRDSRTAFCTDADLTLIRQAHLGSANPCDNNHMRRIMDSEIYINASATGEQKETDVYLSDDFMPPDQRKSPASSSLNQFLFLANAIQNKHLDTPQLRQLQDTDPQIRTIRDELLKNPHHEKYSDKYILRNQILCRISTSRARVAKILAIYLPDFVTEIVLTSLHNHNNLHMSRRTVLQFFNSMFFNPHARSICDMVANRCVSCSFNKNCNIRKTTGKHARDTYHPGSIFCADFIENLPTSSSGHKFICILIDVASHYTIFLPLKNKSSKHLTTEFHKVFSLIGMPKTLEVDLGSAFRGVEFRSFCKLHGIDLIRPGTPHRHHSNRAETHLRHARHFITNLLINGEHNSRKAWSSLIPEITSAYNLAVPHGSINDLSRMALFLGRRPINITSILPDETLRELSIKRLYQSRADKLYHTKFPDNAFRIGQIVRITQGKQDLGNPSGLVPNTTHLARILETSMVGCRVQLLLDSSIRQISYEHLRPLSLGEIHHLHSFPLVMPDHLTRSLPTRGRAKTLYEEVTSQGIGDDFVLETTGDTADDPEGDDGVTDDHLTQEFDATDTVRTTGIPAPDSQLGSFTDPVTGNRRSARTSVHNLQIQENLPATRCEYTCLVASLNFSLFGSNFPDHTIDPLLIQEKIDKRDCSKFEDNCSFVVNDTPCKVTKTCTVMNNVLVDHSDNHQKTGYGHPLQTRRIRFSPTKTICVFNPASPVLGLPLPRTSEAIREPVPLVLYRDTSYLREFVTSIRSLAADK